MWQKAIKVRSPEGKLYPQTAPYDKVMQMYHPELKEQVNDSVYRFVLPKMIAGWAMLTVSGEAGDCIKLRFIGEEGIDFGQSDTYILKGNGEECWEPRFTWHTFREIEVISPKVALNAQSLIVKEIYTDVDETGTFVSSDTILNSIYRKYIHTQKSTCMEASAAIVHIGNAWLIQVMDKCWLKVCCMHLTALVFFINGWTILQMHKTI